jgi:hypothetical protein
MKSWIVAGVVAAMIVLGGTACTPAGPAPEGTGTTSPAPTSSEPSAAPTSAAPVVEGFPDELQGKWCSEDGKTCFSASELLAEHPQAFVQSTDPSYKVKGATDFSICLARDMGADSCTTAASMFLRYFPQGVEWNCDAFAAEGRLDGFTSCRADTVVAHDMTKDRLIILPNHQQDTEYIDSVPMYRK